MGWIEPQKNKWLRDVVREVIDQLGTEDDVYDFVTGIKNGKFFAEIYLNKQLLISEIEPVPDGDFEEDIWEEDLIKRLLQSCLKVTINNLVDGNRNG